MQVACPKCGRRYKIPDAAVGKRAKCSSADCGQVFMVQPPQPRAPAPAAPALMQPAPVSELLDDSGLPPLGPSSPLDDLLAAEAPQATSPLPPAPAPVLAPAPRRRRDWKKPAIIAGAVGVGVLAAVGLVVLLVSAIGGGGGGGGGGASAALAKGGPLEWASWAVPADAQGIGYVNVDKLRESELMDLIKQLAGMASGFGGMPGGMGPSAPMNEMNKLTTLAQHFAEAFFAGTAAGQPVVVLRTHEDMDLDKLAGVLQSIGPPGADPAPKTESYERRTHAGVEYVGAADTFLAKIDTRTFCSADKEADLQAALDRLKAGKPASITGQLRQAVESAQGDHFLAMLVPESSGAASPASNPFARAPFGTPKWVGLGFTVDSHLKIEGSLGFPSEDDVAKIKTEFDKGMEQMDGQMAKIPPGAPPQARAMAENMSNILRSIKLSQSGKTLRVSVNVSIQALKDLFEQFGGMMGAMMGGMRRPSVP